MLMAIGAPLSANHLTNIPLAIEGLCKQVQQIEQFMHDHSKDVKRYFGEHEPDPKNYAIELRDKLHAMADHLAHTCRYKKHEFLEHWDVPLPDEVVIEAPKLETLEDFALQLYITKHLGMKIIASVWKRNGYITLLHESPGIGQCFAAAEKLLVRIKSMLDWLR